MIHYSDSARVPQQQRDPKLRSVFEWASARQAWVRGASLITLDGVEKRQSLAGISGAFTTREAVWLDSSSSTNMSDHTTQLRPTHARTHALSLGRTINGHAVQQEQS